MPRPRDILAMHGDDDNTDESRRLDEALEFAGDRMVRSLQQEERQRRERRMWIVMFSVWLICSALVLVLLANTEWFESAPKPAAETAIEPVVELATKATADQPAIASARTPPKENQVGDDLGSVPTQASPIPLGSGSFTMQLPRGFQWQVTLQALGADRYQLISPTNLNMLGIYQRKDNLLNMEQPVDKRLTEFQWQILGPNQLVLVAEPPAGKTGATYLGTTLTRNSQPPAE